jgi:hypothetical protein
MRKSKILLEIEKIIEEIGIIITKIAIHRIIRYETYNQANVTQNPYFYPIISLLWVYKYTKTKFVLEPKDENEKDTIY